MRAEGPRRGRAKTSLQFGGRTIPAAEVHGSFLAALAAAYAAALPTAEAIALTG